MNTISTRLFLLATLIVVPQLPAAPAHLMMIVSKGLPGITIYDADTEKPLCRATMGRSPHEAAFSPDGEFAYVPVYGSTAVGQPGTDEHMLHFIRTADCSEAGTLDTGKYRRPHGIYAGRSGTVYVTAEKAESVLLVNAADRKIAGTIPTGSQYSHMIAVTPDEKKIFVSDVQSRMVSVLDVPNRKLEKTISTGVENQRMTLSPDGRWFVTDLGPTHDVAFYRTSDDKLDFAVRVSGNPFVAKFNSNGSELYVGGHSEGRIRLWKVDVASKKVVSEISDELGSNLGSIAVSPFNGRVYVSDQETSKISEIDPATWKIAKQFKGDATPDCIVFAERSR